MYYQHQRHVVLKSANTIHILTYIHITHTRLKRTGRWDRGGAYSGDTLEPEQTEPSATPRLACPFVQKKEDYASHHLVALLTLCSVHLAINTHAYIYTYMHARTL